MLTKLEKTRRRVNIVARAFGLARDQGRAEVNSITSLEDDSAR